MTSKSADEPSRPSSYFFLHPLATTKISNRRVGAAVVDFIVNGQTKDRELPINVVELLCRWSVGGVHAILIDGRLDGLFWKVVWIVVWTVPRTEGKPRTPHPPSLRSSRISPVEGFARRCRAARRCARDPGRRRPPSLAASTSAAPQNSAAQAAGGHDACQAAASTASDIETPANEASTRPMPFRCRA
jgi:hypothetical protein